MANAELLDEAKRDQPEAKNKPVVAGLPNTLPVKDKSRFVTKHELEIEKRTLQAKLAPSQ